MPSEKLTFALIQCPLFWEDKKKNFQAFSDKINSIEFDCDVVVLPEMFSTGFTMNAAALGEDMNGMTVQWMREAANKSGKVITGSFIATIEGKHFNRLVWMKPDGSYEYYDKKHLFRMAGEDGYFSAGKENITIEFKGWKIRPLVCYDLRFPVWSRNRYRIENNEAIADYDVLFYVANWPAVRSEPWDILLRARAVENQAYCIGVNRIGKDGTEKDYNGHTAVIGPKGDYIMEPVDKEDGIFKIELEYKLLSDFRKKFPQGLDADDFQLSN